jgi:hypothetical protein
MDQKINLKELERKAFISYHQDGLVDIGIGMILLVSVLSSTLHEAGISDSVRQVIYIPLMLLCPLIIYLGKKYITVPRLGYVKFSPHRQSKRKKVILILIYAFLITMIILTATLSQKTHLINDLLGIKTVYWMALFISIFIMAVFSVLATFLDFRRLFIIGALFAIGEPIYTILQETTNLKLIGLYAHGIPGFILIIIGVLILKKFICTYHTPKNE